MKLLQSGLAGSLVILTTIPASQARPEIAATSAATQRRRRVAVKLRGKPVTPRDALAGA
ncbi:hypothetical protein [Methylocella sp.]|uniref:hypothetical protein n=1 Tax=Methylocella sp. TaxID=1978226 RepID=UPI003C21E456